MDNYNLSYELVNEVIRQVPDWPAKIIHVDPIALAIQQILDQERPDTNIGNSSSM